MKAPEHASGAFLFRTHNNDNHMRAIVNRERGNLPSAGNQQTC